MSTIKVSIGPGAKVPYIHPLEAHFRFLGKVHSVLAEPRWVPFESLTTQDIDSLLAEV